jgi:fimbrial chaperone protein
MFSMPRISTCAAMVVLACSLLGGPLVRPAAAANFNVNPTQVFLSAKATSALVTVRNDSSQPLRFQLSVFAWDQSPSGELMLAPTDDIVFFPALLTLGPNEERKVRVGRVTAPAEREKTYRIFIEEMPPLEAVGTSGGAAVQVLTKMGVPIFVRPAKETATAAIGELENRGGAVRFSLSNTGTVHYVPMQVVLRGLAGTSPVFEQKLDAWYVLAGGRRDFTAAVPAKDCARVTSLVVEVAVNGSSLTQTLDAPAGACSQAQ